MKRPLTASVWQEGNCYVSQCVEIDIATQGETEASATPSDTGRHKPTTLEATSTQVVQFAIHRGEPAVPNRPCQASFASSDALVGPWTGAIRPDDRSPDSAPGHNPHQPLPKFPTQTESRRTNPKPKPAEKPSPRTPSLTASTPKVSSSRMIPRTISGNAGRISNPSPAPRSSRARPTRRNGQRQMAPGPPEDHRNRSRRRNAPTKNEIGHKNGLSSYEPSAI
jgi:hypothetical protein